MATLFPLRRFATPGKQCALIASGDYQPSLRSPWPAAEVAGVVDGGFGAQGAPFLVILLDASVLVVHVQGREEGIGGLVNRPRPRSRPRPRIRNDAATRSIKRAMVKTKRGDRPFSDPRSRTRTRTRTRTIGNRIVSGDLVVASPPWTSGVRY